MPKLYSILALTLLGVPQAQAALGDHFSVDGFTAFANNYVARGVSGSSNQPVVQGCIDLTHDSGAYVGLWGSSGDNGGELDWWGGYRFSLAPGYSLELQLTRFYYPGGTNHQTEGSVSLDTPWVTISARHDWDFGHNYFELNKTLALAPAWQLSLHGGYRNYGEKKYQPDYWAYGKSYADAAAKLIYAVNDKQSLFIGYAWHQDNNPDHATEGKLLFGLVASF
ncbi:TorF family putative porin [Gallaecimonas kandeliae]|uniref:TorF family putative porin n=1 Tax=Gallaecimonas kandeliae TaxID=3029055 RepID=UPI002649AA64|nr:TorF family putative porin [Gallaecimonas kandeliae]WKE65276.1 TorF family putative porin [Gallaecimonas kandeliae]